MNVSGLRAAFARAFLGVLLCVGISQSDAATFVVTTTADGNNGACTVSLCTLRDAVIASNTAGGFNTITLPSNASPYTLTIAGQNEQFAATGDLDILPGNNLTINGGGAATTIIDGGAIDRVFEVVSGATQLTLNDVTVRNGSTAGSSIPSGGGIYAPGTTVILNNSIVSNNNGSTGQGGGIFATRVQMTNSTVSGNHTSNQGGGIFAILADISDSTISGNQSTGDQGGGLFLMNGTTNITNSTINNNTSVGEGGALYFNGSTSAGSPGALNIADSTISNNSSGNAGSGGGLFILSFANVTITRSTLSGNVAGGASAQDGGAIFNTGNLTMTNSTVSGNTASGQGGGITHANVGSALLIFSSTIASNTAPTGANLRNSQGTLTIANTIVANPITGANCSGTIGDDAGNMQFPGNSCGPFTTADPLLGPLANNGGPTQTRLLQTGSPAINAAVSCPPPGTDQRGVSRPQGPACDIGSVEVVPAVGQPTTTTVVSSVNPSIFGQSVTFTATVSGNSPTGTVQFKDGATNLGSPVTLNGSGIATLTTSTLAVGTHPITAVYAGDANNLGSTSNTVSQVVNAAAPTPTTTTLTSSLNPAGAGQVVTFTATVTGTSGPTGSVQFRDGAATLATVTLSGGVATFTTSALTLGTHPISAVYAGDASNSGSTSNTVNEVINAVQAVSQPIPTLDPFALIALAALLAIIAWMQTRRRR